MGNNSSLNGGVKSTDTAIGANGGTGKGIARVTNIGYAVTLLIVLGMAIYLLRALPWDTRMSEGTPSSSSTGSRVLRRLRTTRIPRLA